MEKAVAAEYRSSLKDLNFNSKPLINMLTMLAEENKKYAATIVKTIIDHINSAPVVSKLPGLYLVDSIMKNLGEEYMKIFCQLITGLFTSVFEQVDENTRSLMFKLRQTWSNILSNKILYNLDASVKKIDPAWPITAKCPSKKILVNPKFIAGSSEEKKTPQSSADSSSSPKKGDQSKQKQEDVLKQLLAKQEQLKQLEMQKRVQLAMKKKNMTAGLTTPVVIPFKKNPRDPRMVKINKSQNVSPTKINLTRMVLAKPVTSKPEGCPNNSNTPSTKSIASTTKANQQQSSSVSNVNIVEQRVKSSDLQTAQQKKVSPKSKTEKSTMHKNKETSVSTKKIDEELKSSLTENKAISSKTDKPFIKTDLSSAKLHENTTSSCKTVKSFIKTDINSGKLHESKANSSKIDKPFIKTDISSDKLHESTANSGKTDKPFIKTDISSGKLHESITNSSKTDKPFIKTGINSGKLHEKNTKDSFKESKMTPKKKNTAVNNKLSQVTVNTTADSIKKKVPQMKIPKKTETQKYPLRSDLSDNIDNKDVSKSKKEHITVSSTDINLERKLKNTELNDIPSQPQSVKTNESQENIHDSSTIADKDEDLRIKCVSLSEDRTNRITKRDIVESGSLTGEIDQLHPPRKKMKSEDLENQNPDARSEAPVLFGSEDQDLRHAPLSDINSKDWSQYKANHPDEYSPTPSKQENCDGKFRFRKYQFHKYPYYPDYDRYSPFRPSRGRFFSRRPFFRKYIPRGMRGRFPYNSAIASFMLDSYAYLQQAEEKFRSGKISETEYLDLRRDLQQVAESSDLFKNYLPQKEEVEHDVKSPESQIFKQEHECEPKTIDSDSIRIQKSSDNPPPEKAFVLDGKERVLHFIDDKAIVLMDNNEPHELTFRDENKKIYIDGIAEPLSLGFDGKSVEFELDGRRHIIRLGIPGRELYVNDHPYAAQFGGPPLIAMLEDGRIYKIHLEGPAPQVVIGEKPECELFAKYNLSCKSEVPVSHTEPDIPSLSDSLQDVDMRMKSNSVSQHEILLNKDSPFYSEDMKDVDWRQIPPPSNMKETEKNLHNVFNENQASSYETWINEDSQTRISFQDKNNEVEKFMPKEPAICKWDMAEQQHVQQQNPPVQLLQQRQLLPEELSQHRHPPSEHIQEQQQHSSEHIHEQRQNVANLLREQRQHPADLLQKQREHQVDLLQEQRQHPADLLQDRRQHPEDLLQEQRQQPANLLHEQRNHPSDLLQEQRQHPADLLQDRRQHPVDLLREQRQHPADLFQEHRQHPVEHVQEQTQHPEKHIQDQRQYPPEHIQEQRQYPPEHILQQRPHLAEHVQQQQHPSIHMQRPPQPLHSGSIVPTSTSQEWAYKRDNTYWQNDNNRKNYQPSYREEKNPYQSAQDSSNQHFEEYGKYDSHPHPSYVPYAQRSSFRARHPRGRYPGPRYRPPFNPDFGRPRQKVPLINPPRGRFPAEMRVPFFHPTHLPPPPYRSPAPFILQSDDPARTSAETQNIRTGLLPTPVSSSETQLAKPNSPRMPVDVESLLEKLVAAGIINTKMYEEVEPEPELMETDVKADNDNESEKVSTETEKIELTAESLRMHRPHVISALHSGMQCATCGMRFKETKSDQYSRHLDWHFRMNRREKDTKRSISRTWYYEIEDWIQFEEFEDFEERTPCYFELEAENSQPEVTEVPTVVSVSATNNDQEDCPVCLEKFQLFWVEEEEEWHYRNAVRHDNVTYHVTCYEDFKKSSEAEKALKNLEDANSGSVEIEIEQEITDALNTVIIEVCKTVEVNDIVPDQTNLPNIEEDVKVPPMEVHSEEEILEGKPGEEEIIGLITESDTEIHNESPKAESKMVIMQSGGITLKVKAESLQCHSPSSPSDKDTKADDGENVDGDEEVEFRPPTPDPNFPQQPVQKRGQELSGLCSIM